MLLRTWQSIPEGLRLALYGMVGVLLGLGLYLVRIANLPSYLSDDPRACINCHIMNPEYETWQHSSHGRVTTCNDCHVPHDNVVAKYLFKMEDGLRHSAMFTLHLEPQVIKARPVAQRVIQRNCLRCHGDQLDHAGPSLASRLCLDCHREVPHGRVHSLSTTPNAAVPPLAPVIPEWMTQPSHSSGGPR